MDGRDGKGVEGTGGNGCCGVQKIMVVMYFRGDRATAVIQYGPPHHAGTTGERQRTRILSGRAGHNRQQQYVTYIIYVRSYCFLLFSDSRGRLHRWLSLQLS